MIELYLGWMMHLMILFSVGYFILAAMRANRDAQAAEQLKLIAQRDAQFLEQRLVQMKWDHQDEQADQDLPADRVRELWPGCEVDRLDNGDLEFSYELTCLNKTPTEILASIQSSLREGGFYLEDPEINKELIHGIVRETGD